ncbi:MULTISPECIES: AAA family ATPase [unclassified Novosphingobium]|uniref:AAA family ATPase n=1 Tax=unclassified Novosphingobium TaxID=2644732 RepID=UPI001445B994|nr:MULTISPECIES: AAA family ATPase [unclassified Novosphingobium]NKJ41536.1 putative ATPase [Novosphingobium sp. SG720]NMN03919.1 putative ATPase [Novosphingobium sp. SG919]NMN86091.1 putative ATPase [Novosphingobium sp. SG916]
MSRRSRTIRLPPPFLKRAWLPTISQDAELDWNAYPLSLPIVQNEGLDLTFEKAITIIVGENGSGKSTILEALATMAGFSESGGAAGMRAVAPSVASGEDGARLGELLKAAWLPQVKHGWFFRAESFFSVARYLDEMGSLRAGYLRASHGEGFFSFFEERLTEPGLFILDEPESALSPAKQFEFLKLLRQLQRAGTCQIIMATHSPILMALPDADLWQLDEFGFRPTAIEQTAHFKLYREFVLYPHETVETMID